MVSPAVLEAAIGAYNEYHSPMATAELVDSTADAFAVRFEGPFCRMCCDYDYFEDLIYELTEYGVDSAAVAVEEIEYDGDETFLVEYVVQPNRRAGPAEP
ncbi:hypothetical protein [Halopiger djelfimassiliensis]|uniref:hypothetical protein n=1 Tax=Halopiger djelfimassiliensis TaxID=1293047 RepID=UPI000677EC6C|nr:hypothetical protein [Halopiger djelfimassiliensis]